MILRYEGKEPYRDARFVAEPGDLVEFREAEARAHLASSPDLWEEVKPDGARRPGRRGVQADD